MIVLMIDSGRRNIVCIGLVILCIVQSTSAFYQNDYEPRVFDYLPLSCYDCLSYRDIILTQLTDVPARSFANFNLGSRDTYMILNGHLKLTLHPYAFQSLVVQKPNRTLTITLAAPNSWLNITENTFHGLDLRAYSTLRIIIKFFYGCTFHTGSLAGIGMEKHSRLILDISSVTEIHFEPNIVQADDFHSSVDFFIARTDTITFESHSFASLTIHSSESLAFHFDLVSQIYFKKASFDSLQLGVSSSLTFYSVYLTRLTVDPYAFRNVSLASDATFNVSMRTLGTCLCFRSHSFDSFHSEQRSRNVRVLFHFYGLRGLSFLSHAFSNLSLGESDSNQLTVLNHNPSNDPNTIVNFARDTFSSLSSGSILLNFTHVSVVRFENQSLQTNAFTHKIYLADITLVDLSLIDPNSIQAAFHVHFDHIRDVKWPRLDENKLQ